MVLGPILLPKQFAEFNRKYLAPDGPRWWQKLLYSGNKRIYFFALNFWRLPPTILKLVGPFAFQKNSKNRTFEYPWCYFQIKKPRLKILEIGPGLSGLQFVLASEGHDVTSIDPVVNPSDEVNWEFSDKKFCALNRAFCDQRVRFIRSHLKEAALEDGAFDLVLAISVIEHLAATEALDLVNRIADLLKPGGQFIATVDLFLDLIPFTEKVRNIYGTNISIKNLVDASGLKLVAGHTPELYGYPNFDSNQIAKDRLDYYMANNVLTQCLILEKKPLESVGGR